MKVLLYIAVIYFSNIAYSKECGQDSFNDCDLNSKVSLVTLTPSGNNNFTSSKLYSGDSGRVNFGDPKKTPKPHEKCIETVFCMPTTPLPAEFSDNIFKLTQFQTKNSLTKMRNKVDCTCLTNKYKEELGIHLTRAKLSEKENLQEKILSAYSRKFVNEFSLNMEEATFFITKNRDMFRDKNEAATLQCNDPKAYDALIQSTCKQNGIEDAEFIRKRKDLFANKTFGDQMPFEKRLSVMSDDLLEIRFKNPDGKERVLSRIEYDNGRIGLAHHSEQGKIVQYILKKLASIPNFEKELDGAPNTSPVEKVFALIEKKKNDPEFLAQFDKKIVGEGLTDSKKLKENFRFLMNTHPGFLNAMQSATVFSSLTDELARNSESSVLNILETNQNILEPILSNRCATIITEFANAVCTRDEDLISSVNPVDLENLSHSTTSQLLTNDIHELVMCEAQKGNNPNQFQKLANLYDDGLPARKSDYLERILEPDLKKHKNMFTATLLASADGSNKVLIQELGNASEQGQKISRSIPSAGVVGIKVHAKSVSEGSAFSFGKPAMTRDEAMSFLEDPKKYDSKIASRRSEVLSEVAETPFKTTPSEPSTIKPVFDDNSSESFRPSSNVASSPAPLARRELQDTLSKEYRPEEVSNVMGKVSNESIEEINSLRKENHNLLQKSYEQESRRLESMQSKIEELQQKLSEDSTKSDVKKVARSKKGIEDENDDVSGRSLSSSSEEAAGAPSAGRRMAALAPASESAPSNVAISTSAGVAAPSSDKKAFQQSHDESAKLLIQSGTASPVEQEQINQEVKKLIETIELSEAKIEDIKLNGIKIRFKVLENAAFVEKEKVVAYASLSQRLKDLLDLKMNLKKRTSLISKLSVLKMLLNQSR